MMSYLSIVSTNSRQNLSLLRNRKILPDAATCTAIRRTIVDRQLFLTNLCYLIFTRNSFRMIYYIQFVMQKIYQLMTFHIYSYIHVYKFYLKFIY